MEPLLIRAVKPRMKIEQKKKSQKRKLGAWRLDVDKDQVDILQL